MSRSHPIDATGRQVLVPSLARLTAAERRRLPAAIRDAFERFSERVAEAPAPFEWLPAALEARPPVLERAHVDGRDSWSVRLAHPFGDALLGPCFGFDADPEGAVPALVPQPLAWARATFGTVFLQTLVSGTAPMGRTLDEVVARERASFEAVSADFAALPGYEASNRWDRFADLPDGWGDWVTLYETDGDWVVADVARDETIWVGSEWTGEPALRFALPWRRAAAFVMWRLLDGGTLRPADLRMLAR